MEDRLTDLLTGKNVDCCGKCRYFEKSDDPLDHTKSFGHCNYLKSEDEKMEGVFKHEYCENFSPLNPYSNDTKFYIALFKNEAQSYHYLKDVKPIDFQKDPCGTYGKRKNDISLLFDISDCIIHATTYQIDNKLPDNIYGCTYIISTEDKEQELKDTLVKYILHHLEENIKQYEEWLKETRDDYTFYSKFLRERNF